MSDEKHNQAIISGTVEMVGQTQEFSSGFTKRQMVVNTGGTYPKTIPVDFKKDKTALLDGYTVGDPVEVHVFIDGREYNGRYYVDLTGWRIDGHPSGGEPAGDDTDGGEAVAESEQENMPF